MNCLDARPLLDLLCDGALEAKDSVHVLDHMKTCQDCQREWQALEELHSNFQHAKGMTQIPAGLMDRISDKLKDEERRQQRAYFKVYTRNVSLLAIAASFVVVGFLVISWINGSAPSRTQLASTNVLIDDVVSEATLEPVADRRELAKKLGYDLKYVNLADWRLDKAGIYKSHAPTPIARFDFIRKGNQRMTCYQAPQGVIRPEGATAQNISGKHVFFGHHGKFQFALWTQNERDYLMVTTLPESQLAEIVHGA